MAARPRSHAAWPRTDSYAAFRVTPARPGRSWRPGVCAHGGTAGRGVRRRGPRGRPAGGAANVGFRRLRWSTELRESPPSPPAAGARCTSGASSATSGAGVPERTGDPGPQGRPAPCPACPPPELQYRVRPARRTRAAGRGVAGTEDRGGVRRRRLPRRASEARERDLRRDAALAALGWVVLRFGYRGRHRTRRTSVPGSDRRRATGSRAGHGPSDGHSHRPEMPVAGTTLER